MIPSGRPRLVVALTGGIGSGKTTVSQHLAELGAAVIDTDLIAHALTAPGGAAMAAIATAFGPGAIAADGSLDRVAMRRLIFNDARARHRLEAILHPLIRARMDEQLAQVQAPYAVLAIPLLFETGWTDVADRILVVDLPESLQVTRVMARGDLSAEEVRPILASQARRETRRQGADDLIDNSGILEDLMARTADLHRRYLRLAQKPRPQ
ncbi:MAG: dephospho-CoA kinase [Chromatiaceae bacterium]|nr:dephospho-CoA kinase [Chromatiaceae bacterium]